MPISTANSVTTDRTRLIARLGQKFAADSIAKRAAGETAPLSYSQERLWIMSQLEPDNPIYNVAGAVRFDGALGSELLAQALSEVVRRHEILRSRFLAIDGLPCQKVEAEAALPLEHMDLSALAESEKMSAFETGAQDFIRRPFRLDRQPPLRGLLADLGGERHILLLTLHHMVSDRWSVAVLMQEVAALYKAFAEGLPSPLPELPIQYADYCVWQRGCGAQRQSQLEYWTAKLSGVPPLLELPLDRPRPPQPSYRGEVYSFELGDELSRQVKQLAGQYKATLFMVMAAAFSVLLYRYSGSRDFCIGYPVAGRNRSQVAGLIGFFVNTLVLRCRIDGEISFVDWLTRLREQALQDQNHQELAFGQLLDALNPPRNPSHAPLFQVMLAVQNVPVADFSLPGLQVESLPLSSTVAQYDLTLFVDEQEDRLRLAFEYCTDLFSRESVTGWAGHLQVLLAGVVSRPDLALSRLPLLNTDEYLQLVRDWSGRELACSEQTPVHRLFTEQSLRYPERPALVFSNRVLTYRELHRQAELWGMRLNQRGIGRSHRVGVCLPRSAELIVVLLGVLKSGAAYVPLDPDYPDDRLRFMSADVGIELLVTHRDLIGKFAGDGVEMLLADCLPDDAAIAALVDVGSKRREPGLLETAYVIYTSGSTGKPKGVAVSHGNLLHSTLARSRYYREPLSGFLLLSSFAFDSSVAGIFWTLVQGGCLCLPEKEALADPNTLADLIECHGISHLLALPSFYAAIVEAVDPIKLKSLKVVIVAGEACSGDVAAKHSRSLPDVAFYNEYGPTENTVWSSVYRLEGKPEAWLPIGRPIDNVKTYILDRCLQPVPIGVAGELYLGGAGVAQGYLKRPALSAERFVPDPFQPAGGRLYRTGDLARYRFDGEIEFLGRIDQQVKIRGYRIELGEIEEQLLQHSAVKEAAVVLNHAEDSGPKLIAYWVAWPNQEPPEPFELESFLRRNLPAYMLPSSFRMLESMPLTANGKRDLQYLAGLADDSPRDRVNKIPSNWIEVALAEIWTEVLGLNEISTDADFFSVGGHSLAAIQVRSRILQRFNIDIDPKRLFEASSIETLATEIVHLHAGQLEMSDLSDLLAELEQLSDEDAKLLLLP